MARVKFVMGFVHSESCSAGISYELFLPINMWLQPMLVQLVIVKERF